MSDKLLEKMESLLDDVEGTIRNGAVSGDTKLIAKSILLNAHAIMQLTNVLYQQTDHIVDVVNSSRVDDTLLKGIGIEIYNVEDTLKKGLENIRAELVK